MMRKFIVKLAGKLEQKTKRRPDDRRGQHKEKGGGQHPGLLLQRYLCENATGEGGNPEEKRAILQAAINAATNNEVRELYRTAFDRWAASLPTDPAPVDLQTVDRLIVGLGSENVLETGIRLHHTYGMPIIPGSALKGLAAHYCDQVWGDRNSTAPSEDALAFRGPRREDRQNNHPAEPQGKFHRLLFGTTDDSGCITFHDAWLVPGTPDPLKMDVMTPHHPKWLDGTVAPTDFDSPTPVPFLSVAGRFRVALAWQGPEHAEAKRWTQLACSLLKQALSEWGIGSKTTSGYGRLIPVASSSAGGQVQSHAAPEKPKEPVHQPREKIQVIQRTVDGKLRYEADDGFLGSLLKGTPPDLEDGESTEFWIVRVDMQNEKVPYVFQTDQPAPPKQKTKKQNRKRP